MEAYGYSLDKLHNIIQERGLKRKKLIEDWDCHLNVGYEKLNGRQPISLEEAKILADKLGNNIEDIFF